MTELVDTYPTEPEPEKPEPEEPDPWADAMASPQRLRFDGETADGAIPSLDPDDVAFLAGLRASPGGYLREGRWVLPSGLPLTGEEIAALPEGLFA